MPKLMIDDLYSSMPWDVLDAVVFDVGNVLLSFQPKQILMDIVPDQPEKHPALLQQIFQSPYWVMMDHGLLDLQGAADAMCIGAPELEEPIRRVMREWIEMPHVIQEGLNALQACKEHGKKVYVLSNYGYDSFAYAEQKYDFFGLFDGKVISGREKIMKPGRAIYDLLTARFDLDPARTLFIDDSPANIEAALFAGWQGLCFNAPGKLQKFVTEK